MPRKKALEFDVCKYASVGVECNCRQHVCYCRNREQEEHRFTSASETMFGAEDLTMPNRVLFIIIMCSALFSPNARAAILMMLITLRRKYAPYVFSE